MNKSEKEVKAYKGVESGGMLAQQSLACDLSKLSGSTVETNVRLRQVDRLPLPRKAGE